MPDVYASITEMESGLLERLTGVLELRAADPRQRAMLNAYLGDLEFPPNAEVLEIGCGTGAVARTLAQWPRVARTVGVDPSSVFVAKARELGAQIPNLSFVEADGRSLPFDANTFDVVVLHTTLCHVPSPEQVLAEAFRVLRQGGALSVFDGDYATTTVALGDFDPLEECVRAFIRSFVHDPWLVRRLPALLRMCDFEVAPTRSHGYVEAGEGGYMLTLVDRGVDVLLQDGRIGAEMADALKTEARRRSTQKTWFGYISFANIVGRKPHR